MAKKVLMCEYCRHLIKETDVKCPNCGANCSKIIADYKAEQEAEAEARHNEFVAAGERRAKKVMLAGGAFMIVPIFMFIMATAGIIGAVIHFNKNEGPVQTSNKKESVTGTLDGEGKNEKFSVKIDGYEEYEYTSDSFQEMCNTRDGYKKVAFHIVVTNESNETIDASLIRDIELKIGDEMASKASLEENSAFCDLVQGEKEYTFFPYNGKILSGDKLSGYRGFVVSKKVEKIKFIINDDIVIEMDNPVYEKNY